MDLYVTDLDGTLLTRQEKLSPFTLQALNSLIDQGLPLTFATARSPISAAQVTAGLRWRLPIIVFNGAFILAPDGTPLHQESFSPKEAAWVRDAAGALGLWPLVDAFVAGAQRKSWLAGRETPGQGYYLQNRQNDPRMRPVQDERALYEGKPFYFTFIGERESLLPLYEQVAAQPGFTVTFQQELYRTEYWLEIMPKGATKANAARKLQKLLGYDRLIAFGDAINDLPLFAAADHSCAVANAVPELKAAATEAIAANTEDGVARWLLSHGERAGFSLRPYQPADLEEAYRLFYETVHTVCRQDYTPAQCEAWAKPMDKWDREGWRRTLSAHYTLIAIDNAGAMAGFADLDGGYLDRLYIRADFQGRGAGRALVQALEAEAAHGGFEKVAAHVSHTARAFFEKMGYTVTQKNKVQRPHPITGEPVTLENFAMEKELVL